MSDVGFHAIKNIFNTIGSANYSIVLAENFIEIEHMNIGQVNIVERMLTVKPEFIFWQVLVPTLKKLYSKILSKLCLFTKKTLEVIKKFLVKRKLVHLLQNTLHSS